ncbi:mCG18358, isoform CRA_b, partial [Mus musculus]
VSLNGLVTDYPEGSLLKILINVLGSCPTPSSCPTALESDLHGYDMLAVLKMQRFHARSLECIWTSLGQVLC